RSDDIVRDASRNRESVRQQEEVSSCYRTARSRTLQESSLTTWLTSRTSSNRSRISCAKMPELTATHRGLSNLDGCSSSKYSTIERKSWSFCETIINRRYRNIFAGRIGRLMKKG